MKTRKVNKQDQCGIQPEFKDGYCIYSKPFWTGSYKCTKTGLGCPYRWQWAESWLWKMNI